MAFYLHLSWSKSEYKGRVLIYIRYVVQLCNKQLMDEVFVISGIIEVEGESYQLSLRSKMITLTDRDLD